MSGGGRLNYLGIDLGKGVAVSVEGTDLRKPEIMSDLWLGPNDLGKGMVESNSPTGEVSIVVSKEGTDFRKPERMSSGKCLWRGLSKCSSSDLGKGISETCATGEVGVAVSAEGTDFRKTESMSSGKGLWLGGFSKCEACAICEVNVAVSEEGTDLRKSETDLTMSERMSTDLRMSKRMSTDLGKGMSETCSICEVVAVSEEGTDLRKSERVSTDLTMSAERMSTDLRKSKRMPTDLGKGVSETCAICEVDVAVSEKGTDLRKSERVSTDLTMSERMSTDLKKSKRISSNLRKSKRMCLGKGLWIGVGKCFASYPSWKGKENRKRKRVSKIHRPLKFYLPSDIDYYFPSTYLPIFPNTLVEPPGPIEVTYLPTKEKLVKFVKGLKLEKDVVSLLSNDGKRDYLVRNNGDKVSVDSIAGKHLLICCLKVPLPNVFLDAYICRAMIAAYSHLVENNENFEMVMIAKMVGGDGDDEETAFNRFFKAFPCLAVPFWDAKSRNFLCRSLDLTSPWSYHAAAVLDPNQVVLQRDVECFYHYGALGFPYSDARLDALIREDAKTRSRLDFEWNNGRLKNAPVSLVELLGSDVVLSRFGGDDKMYASDMSKKKCVVLYLCVTGMRMRLVKRIRERCAAENLECEVVLVHISFMWDTPSFVYAVQLALERLEISSWWVAPLIDGEAARRLGRLCSLFRDSFIFLADGGNAVELEGEMFMDHFRSWGNKIYPFTRMTMAQDFFDRLSKVTLESLLLHPCRRDKVGGSVPVSDLKGRKVLLYFDWCRNICKGEGRLYRKLLRYNEKIKKDHPALEVILAPLNCQCPGTGNNVGHSWLVHPHAAEIYEQIFIDGGFRETLVAFGEDGIVRSRKAQRRLKRGSLFKDTLFREIVRHLEGYLED